MLNLLKLKFILFLFIIFLSGCFFLKDTEQQKKLWEEISNNYNGYDDLKESIEKNGHRFTTSLNAYKTEELIYDKLKSYGLNPDFSFFELEIWNRVDVKLLISSNDNNVQLETVSLALSPRNANISAQIIDVGDGLRKDFEFKKDSIKRKIVLINLDLDSTEDLSDQNLHRSEKTALAINYGAVGVIFINPYKGGVLFTGAASVTGSLIPIPAVCITNEDGEEMRSNLTRGDKITAMIQMHNESKKLIARNVTASITGTKFPDEKIVIGGHLDSWDLADGAIDNGIGVFSILDIARAFAITNTQCNRTVEFAFWSGNEQGLCGSIKYIKDNYLKDIRYYINIDMTGNPSGFNVEGRDEMTDAFMEIGETIQMIDSTFKNELKSKVSIHSDNVSFAIKGIPTLQIIGNLDPVVYKYYHSNKDKFDLVNKDHMKYTSAVMAVTLFELANMRRIEAQKLTSDQISEFYEKAGLKEKMIVTKQWKWDLF